MAIAANEIQCIVQQRIPIGSGRAIYFGTCTGGTGYVTGGTVIGNDTVNSRFPLPEKLDAFQPSSATGTTGQLLSSGKYKVLGAPTSEGTVAVEFKSANTLATAFAAGTPFMAIGDQ